MKPSQTSIKILLRLSQFYIVLLYYVILLLLSAAVLYSGVYLYGQFQSYQSAREEVMRLQAVVDRVTRNKLLVEEKIDTYLKTLTQLIPESESYFAVVSALEMLSRESGVRIESYNIDATVANAKKITLQVQIEGTEGQVRRFFETYQYSGGRLVTCEKISTTNSQKNKLVLLLNFYHEVSDAQSGSQVVKISPKDIELIEEIDRKMNR